MDAAQGDALEVLHGHVLNPPIGVLHGHHVVVAADRVDPVAGSDHAVDEAGFLAVDAELDAGVVDVLGNIGGADLREGTNLCGQLLGETIGLVDVVRTDLHIDGRWQALVDDAVNEAAGLEVSGEFGHLAGEPIAHALHVHITADGVAFLEAGLYEGGIHGGVGGEDGGEVGIDADVGDDHVQIFRLDFFADDLLDARDVLVADLEAGARRHAHVDDELTRVGAGKVGSAEEGEGDGEQDHANPENAGRGESGAQQGAAHQAFVPVDHALKVFVELPDDELEAEAVFGFRFVLVNEPAAFVALVVAVVAQEQRAEERDDGHGEGVGGEHGKHHAEGQRREQILADSGKGNDGQKDDGGGDRGSQDGERDFSSAFFGGDARRLTEFHVAEDVFEHDDAVVNEAGEGEGQTAEDHGVDGAAEGVGHQHTGQGGERNREHHGHGGARAAEEEQDHDAGEYQADPSFIDQLLEGELDEDGLIEDDGGFERGRNVDEVFDGFFHAVDDGDGIAVAALLEDRDVDRALTIDAHDVVLQRAGVHRMADIGDQHGSVAHRLEGHLVHGLGGGKLAVRVNVEVFVPDAHIASGQNQVGAVHGLDHVAQAQVARLQLERIDVDLDLAVGSAKGLWNGRARHVGNLIAHLELGQVLELGFVEPLALESDKADGLGGGGETQHHGGQRSGREPAQVGHGEIGHVAERGVGIGTGLEIELDEADAGEGPRLAVVHVGGEGEEALEGIGDIRFDLLGRHAVVEGGDDDHGHVDVGEEVDGHAEQVHDAHDRDDEAQHENEIGILQRKLGHFTAGPRWRSLLPRSCRSCRRAAARFPTRASSPPPE